MRIASKRRTTAQGKTSKSGNSIRNHIVFQYCLQQLQFWISIANTSYIKYIDRERYDAVNRAHIAPISHFSRLLVCLKTLNKANNWIVQKVSTAVRTLNIMASISVKIIVESSVLSKFTILMPRSTAHRRPVNGKVDSKKYFENF